MNATISLEGLWSIVDSLSIKNKKWLANRLQKELLGSKAKKEDKIVSAIAHSLEEAKEGKTFPIDTLWEQL